MFVNNCLYLKCFFFFCSGHRGHAAAERVHQRGHTQPLSMSFVTDLSSIHSRMLPPVPAEPGAAGERLQQPEEADRECAALWRTGGGGCQRF